MARYAGGGKNTVEGCRSIDVLEWHRRGYLRIAAVVLVGLDQGWRAGGVHQRRNPTPFGDADSRRSPPRSVSLRWRPPPRLPRTRV